MTAPMTWACYKRLADRPDCHSRWLLEHTLNVLQTQLDSASLRVGATLTTALAQAPIRRPPDHIGDQRTAIFAVQLDLAATALLVRLFETGLRANEGFLHAWQAHYNQLLEEQLLEEQQGGEEVTEVEVRSEVAGSVWKLLVAEGDQVAADAELMILESMKMEIPVEAPYAGRVKRLLVAADETVEEEQHLLTLER
jgi:biotin carboxyl carrier protein